MLINETLHAQGHLDDFPLKSTNVRETLSLKFIISLP